MLAAAAPLTVPQRQSLERGFICPERLPDDGARLSAITRFMDEYARLRPAATVNDRLAQYDELLARRRCAPRGDTAHYSFPQS
ncbi:hypothetical protein [Glacieibacterium frigidum]|uniref:Uncharacterized protein n=1 Tax=Glacieibacterium frigidum TaxID=2593303 RepID=A0A552U7Z1_9SPHN|nr:hypothetical protein [Glacieibacterium frigidum]TRW14337.1 hypothetical protein FMM06_11540 [Glacieibacterium frigidum]